MYVEQSDNEIQIRAKLIERQSLDIPTGFLLLEKRLIDVDRSQWIEENKGRHEHEYVVVLRSRFMNDKNKEEIIAAGEKWAKDKSVERQVMQSENDNSIEKKVVVGTTWQHYNTFGIYEVLQIVEDASRHEEGKVVIYCNVEDRQKVFARPLAEWFNNVRHGSGFYGHRFEEVARLRDGYVFRTPIDYTVPEYHEEDEVMKTSVTSNGVDPDVLEIEVICSMDHKELWKKRISDFRNYLDKLSDYQVQENRKPIDGYKLDEETDAQKSR